MAGPYLVTRLPGAPPRRAGRIWEEDHPTIADDMSTAQVAALAADPGYVIGPYERPEAWPDPAPAAPAKPRAQRTTHPKG